MLIIFLEYCSDTIDVILFYLDKYLNQTCVAFLIFLGVHNGAFFQLLKSCNNLFIPFDIEIFGFQLIFLSALNTSLNNVTATGNTTNSCGSRATL